VHPPEHEKINFNQPFNQPPEAFNQPPEDASVGVVALVGAVKYSEYLSVLVAMLPPYLIEDV